MEVKKPVMQWNPALASEVIKPFEKGPKGESPCLYAYLCPAGIWTIGWGHTKGVAKGKTISEATAIQYLTDDLAEKQKFMASLIKVEITEQQFIALLSFFFNVRSTSIKNGRVWKFMNEGRPDKAIDLMCQYVTSGGKALKGLQRRRFAEREIFLNGMGSDWRKWLLAETFPKITSP